jgi:hypothetical protein
MNNDWKPTENNISSPWDVNVQENNIGEPLKTGVVDWDALSLRIEQPKVICRCDLFGQQQLVISFYDTEVKTLPIPNGWIRFWTRVFFNSKWEFVND